MSPPPSSPMPISRLSRRYILGGGLAAGATLGLGGCAAAR